MASSVSSTAEVKELRISYEDIAGETAVQTLVLSGLVSSAAIALYIDHLEAVTNAKITAKVVVSFPVDGIANTSKPATSGQSLLAAIAALDFQKTNPINSLKTVSKQVLIPAYLDAIRNDEVKPHVPVTDNTNLNAMIAMLESNLDYLGGDGAHYGGEFTYNPASKFGTKPTITDGF